jgi:hypothetical protein
VPPLGRDHGQRRVIRAGADGVVMQLDLLIDLQGGACSTTSPACQMLDFVILSPHHSGPAAGSD